MHAIPILMYTSFTIDNKSTDSNSTSINKFEMDIRTLIDNGYAPIRLCDYHYHLSQNDEANEKLFSVIFVGGYENNYTLAFPLLKKYNIQASVFVAIDLVGVYEYPEVPGFTPHFGWEQAQEMIDSGLVDIYPWWHPFDEGKSIHEEIQRKEDILMKNLRDRSSKKAILYKDLDSNIVSIMNQLGLDIIITDCFHITANNIKAGVAASIQVGFNENVLDIIEHYSYLCNDTIEKDMSVTNIAAAPLSEVSSRVNNESIILEIDEKPRIKNYLRSAFPLAILQAANKEKTERFIINNFIDLIYKPHYMELQRKESKEFLDDLTTRDQRMMCATITLVHVADSKEQLDSDTEALLSTARRHLCQLAVLKFQQMDGLNTVLPIGCRKINVLRTLTTESLAVFMPFKVQEIGHERGIYYGQNAISNNMIIANRRHLLNGNSFILGVSGSGKSFTGKCEISNLMLDGDSDIIIIDPEREYAPLVKALGGEIIDISATSKNHINAMDMNKEYGDGEDPVILKSEFILSLCEQLIGSRSLGAKEKSLIDRCTKIVYRNYKKRGYKGTVPTLKEFRAELLKQEEAEAQDIALAIELFTDGSLDTFAKQTNVDVENRLICYDILDLGKQLLPIGMLVVLDSILNRITANRAKGKNTFIFIDEIYLLFQHKYSANFLFTLWKRVRKYGAFCTGITQNVDDLLQSHTARTMLANSEFVIMLNQASTDRIKLAELLNISDTQLSYITNVEAGRGLMKVGSALVPFVNKFPKNTKLYRLMTTKPGEN